MPIWNTWSKCLCWKYVYHITLRPCTRTINMNKCKYHIQRQETTTYFQYLELPKSTSQVNIILRVLVEQILNPQNSATFFTVPLLRLGLSTVRAFFLPGVSLGANGKVCQRPSNRHKISWRCVAGAWALVRTKAAKTTRLTAEQWPKPWWFAVHRGMYCPTIWRFYEAIGEDMD